MCQLNCHSVQSREREQIEFVSINHKEKGATKLPQNRQGPGPSCSQTILPHHKQLDTNLCLDAEKENCKLTI